MIARAMLLVLACLLRPAVAQDEAWITVGRTDKMTWHVKPGSVTLTEMQGNVPVVMVIGRITVHATSRITLYKWYVSVSDCERGMGELVALTLDGVYRYKQDFVYGAETAAAGMAAYICALNEEAEAFGERGKQVK